MFVDKILEAYDVERIAELCEQDQQIAPYCRMAGRRSGRLVLAASKDEQQGTARPTGNAQYFLAGNRFFQDESRQQHGPQRHACSNDRCVGW